MKKKKILIVGALVLTFITLLFVPTKKVSACEDGSCDACYDLGFESGTLAGQSQQWDYLYFKFYDNYDGIFDYSDVLSPDEFSNLDSIEKEEYFSYFISLVIDHYYNEGFDAGDSNGYNQGLEEGFEDGYNTGYDAGSVDSLLNFFHKYDDELLGPFKNCRVYVRNAQNTTILSNEFEFSGLAPLIYHDGIFDFNLLFDLLIKDNLLFSNIDSRDVFDFVFVFADEDIVTVKDLNTLVGGFTSITLYGPDLPDYSYTYIFNDLNAINGPLGVGFYDFSLHAVSLCSGTYSTFQDKSMFFSTESSEYYFVGYEKGNYDGYVTGKEDGYDIGYGDAKDKFYDLGYGDGYLDNNFSLQSLFWTIAGLPFESFKAIWDVNFLGIYIADFITGLLLAGVAIFIMKRVIF